VTKALSGDQRGVNVEVGQAQGSSPAQKGAVIEVRASGIDRLKGSQLWRKNRTTNQNERRTVIDLRECSGSHCGIPETVMSALGVNLVLAMSSTRSLVNTSGDGWCSSVVSEMTPPSLFPTHTNYCTPFFWVSVSIPTSVAILHSAIESSSSDAIAGNTNREKSPSASE
jgi:hypothetical protein